MKQKCLLDIKFIELQLQKKILAPLNILLYYVLGYVAELLQLQKIQWFYYYISDCS